jgi:hypothetical protein
MRAVKGTLYPGGIQLPPGSYAPSFQAADSPSTAAPVEDVPVASAGRRKPWLIGVLLACIAGLGGVVYLRGGGRPASTELDRFWDPLVSSPGAVQICIGQSRAYYYPNPLPTEPKSTIPVGQMVPIRDRFLFLGDSICMSKVTGYLYSRNNEMQYRGSDVTPCAELRGTPVILIGAFNNDGATRIVKGLRFSLVEGADPNVRLIADAQNPGNPSPWRVVKTGKTWEPDVDYAVVTRLLESSLERWVIVLGGITQRATLMSGDFLPNPEYFRETVKSAPPDWAHRNMQIILETRVVGGTPGPPRVAYILLVAPLPEFLLSKNCIARRRNCKGKVTLGRAAAFAEKCQLRISKDSPTVGWWALIYCSGRLTGFVERAAPETVIQQLPILRNNAPLTGNAGHRTHQGKTSVVYGVAGPTRVSLLVSSYRERPRS